MRSKFLHFCTGSSRVPLDGFKSLLGRNFWRLEILRLEQENFLKNRVKIPKNVLFFLSCANPDKDEPKLFSILLLDNKKKDNSGSLYTPEEINQRLPKAHTCFNRLDLPRYSSKQVMMKKLIYCLENEVGFGIE